MWRFVDERQWHRSDEEAFRVGVGFVTIGPLDEAVECERPDCRKALPKGVLCVKVRRMLINPYRNETHYYCIEHGPAPVLVQMELALW